MAHGPRRNQKGNNQPQRVEVVAQQADNPQPPHSGNQYAAQWDQYAVGLAEVEDQQRQHGQYREGENLQNLIHIGVGPAHQHWLAGGVQGNAVGCHLVAQVAQLDKGLFVVELAFNQLGLDQCHL